MLKRFCLVAVCILMLSAPVFAADFNEGKKAYDEADWVRAIYNLRPLAEAGDDRALILLGNMYSEGRGVIQDYREAYRLYYKAATEKENSTAMVALAAMYEAGLGASKNLPLARQWFGRAAEMGSQTGAFFYAILLYEGQKSVADDIKPDLSGAYKWFKIAAAGTDNLNMQKAAEGLAALVGEKMTPEEKAEAEQSAAAFKPRAAAELGTQPEAGAEVKPRTQEQQAQPPSVPGK